MKHKCAMSLYNFMHAAMAEDRLIMMALMHIHYQFHIDLDIQVVKVTN